MSKSSATKNASDFSSTAFPTAEDMKRWHALSLVEQEQRLKADIQEGLDGPAAQRQSKDDIVSAALAAYADAL